MWKYFLVTFSVISLHAHAQQFGAVPAGKKFKQTGNPSVRVIFPESFDSIAFRIADIANGQQKKIHSTIGNATKKISIILHNEVSNSNGYVALGPFRSEFYLTPPVDVFGLGAMRWEDMLTLHEYRHIQQYNNFNRGFSKFMSRTFGENGRALANALSVPNWFFEGDAVYTETILSRQGRGRMPAFHNRFKVLYTAGKHYSYMKLRNGSYKDYVPDHYALGYLFVAYGYEKYGEDFWKHVTQNAAAFKPPIYPLQRNIQKYAGVNFNRFTEDAFNFYHHQWKKDVSDDVKFQTGLHKNNVENYKYPYPVNPYSSLFLKNSYRKIPAFYLYEKGAQKKIAAKNISREDYYSYNNGKIIYTSYTPDTRWAYREFSDITVLDMASGKQQKITNRKRYYTPDISKDGKSIVATELLPDQTNSVVLMNERGEKQNSLKANAHHIFTYPKFIDNDTIAAIERNEKGEMRLVKIGWNGGKIEPLTPFANTLIGYPVVCGDTLFYTRSAAQYDEAMAYVIPQKQIYKLATYSTGIYQSYVQHNKLSASIFTAAGYRLAAFVPKWEKVENASADTLHFLYNVLPANADAAMLSGIEEARHSYPVKDYKPFYGLLHFHSMQPYFTDPDYTLSFLSQNLLNTFLAKADYTFNRVERFHRASLSAVYGGWYVQPFVQGSATYKRETTVLQRDSSLQKLNWNELNISTGLQLPLNFSGGKMYRYLNLSSAVNSAKVFYTKTPQAGNYQDKNILYISNRITYSQQIQKALQQIYPSFAQNVSLNFRKAFQQFNAYQLTAAANLYFPGVVSNHSFMLSGAFQKADTLGNYVFSNIFPFSRGYPAFYYQKMMKFGLNYHFPIAYPEVGVGNIIYVKRLRNNLFFDHTFTLDKKNRQYNFASAGTEIFLDTNWWNQLPVSFGLRFSYLLNDFTNGKAPYRWEIILPVNLYN